MKPFCLCHIWKFFTSTVILVIPIHLLCFCTLPLFPPSQPYSINFFWANICAWEDDHPQDKLKTFIQAQHFHCSQDQGRVLETANGQILVNGEDKPGLQTGSCNTRECYLLETLTHNSPCPPRCKFRASSCFRETQDTAHQLTSTSCNTENQHPKLHPEK